MATIKLISTSALLALLAIATCSPNCIAERRSGAFDYILGFHFASVGGQNSAYYFDIASSVANKSFEETGLKVDIKKFASNKDVAKAFLENKIDGGLLDIEGIIEIIEGGGKVFPWATYVIGKTRKNAHCVWHKKSEPVSSYSELSGKSFLVIPDGYFAYIQMRDQLYEAGVDKPLWKVFKTFVTVPNVNSYYIALVKGEADVGWGGMEADSILKAIQPDVRAQLKYGLCTEPKFNRGMIAINEKTVPKEDIALAEKTLRETIMSLDKLAKKNPQFQAPLKYTKLIKMKFIPASSDEYYHEIELYKKAKKNGWADEARFIQKKLQSAPMGKPLEIRPDMDYCKSICKGKGSDCVLKCVE